MICRYKIEDEYTEKPMFNWIMEDLLDASTINKLQNQIIKDIKEKFKDEDGQI